MRLISQNGNVDLPYENTVLLHNMEYVIAKHDGKEYVMGKYSCKEKVYKVMDMLCGMYMCYATVRSDGGVFRFPKDEEVED